MNLEPLTDENFLLFAAKHYRNPLISTEEFLEDLLHLKYIKKLATRYFESGELKDRLLLNHIIVLSNVFPPEILCKILWLKMEEKYLTVIKPFLVLLQVLPDKLYNVNGQVIDTTLISMEPKVVTALREIKYGS